MRAEACGAAVLQNKDTVRVLDGADALGHDDLCGIRKVARQRAAQRSVRLVVQRAGAVVQQQDLRVSRKGAGQQHALLLPAAQVGAFCGQLSGKTALTLCNEIRLRRACRRSSLLRGNSPPEVDVFTDFIRVEKVVLKHHAELAVQHLGRNGTNVASVQPYRAAVRVVKTQQQPENGGFSAARRPNDAQRLAPFQRKADV